MQIGVCASCVVGKDLEAQMAELKRIGYDFIEPAWKGDEDHAKLGTAMGRELKKLGGRTGCPVLSAIHGSFVDLGLRLRAGQQAKELDILTRCCETLAAAGGSVLLCPNWAGENGEDFDKLYIEFLREAAVKARGFQVALGIEHIPRSKYRNTAVLVYELAERVNRENVGVYYDIANGLYAGEDNAASARCVAPRVNQFHVKDYNKGEIPLEKMPLKEVQAVFGKDGFRGRVAVELGPQGATGNAHLERALRTLRENGY